MQLRYFNQPHFENGSLKLISQVSDENEIKVSVLFSTLVNFKKIITDKKELEKIILVDVPTTIYPDIRNINRFIQNLKDMRAYEDMLDEFIFGDQKTYPDDKRPVGSKDVMTLDEIMNDLQLRFMDERDKNNGKD